MAHSSVLSKLNLIRQSAALVLALGALSGMKVVSCYAEEDHAMHMDHFGHEQPSGNSLHEHHMDVKAGITSRSVVTYVAPGVKLINQNAEEVALRELLDSRAPIILNFIFTSCTTICPVQSGIFRQVQQDLGKRKVRMLSISIDPENDTPAKLKAYAKKFSVGPQWTLLTGSLENSIAVQKAFGVFVGDKMDQKAVTFLKAKGADNSWVRLDGLVEAEEIISEFDKLNH